MPSSTNDQLAELQARLGLNFSNVPLLVQALTHKSYAVETGTSDNARLGTLGDSVILMLVVDHIYQQFPEANANRLEQLKKELAGNASLAVVALELGLLADCLLAKGARTQLETQLEEGKTPEVILGGLVQALVGAIYLDQGADAARRFVVTHIITPKLPAAVERLDRG